VAKFEISGLGGSINIHKGGKAMQEKKIDGVAVSFLFLVGLTLLFWVGMAEWSR
jgi:hypothetical protein